jgi:hypothetical protein
MGSQVYLNKFPTINSPPTAPSGLNSIPLGNSVTMAWLSANDANQSGGITYNVRVGTVPGLANIVSPLADCVSGRRWVSARGNASESLRWRLRNLAPGTYYWSVQAIDNAGAESPFAEEMSFVITEALPTILSASLVLDNLSLEVSFVSAGNYSILTSSNLTSWNNSFSFDSYAGTTNLVLPISGTGNQFVRLRRN